MIGDPAFDRLLDTETSGKTPVTLSGLTPGDDYLVEFYMTDNRPNLGGRTVTVNDGQVRLVPEPSRALLLGIGALGLLLRRRR